MKKIYSKVAPQLLCHVIYTLGDFSDGRRDIINPTEFIQCSALKKMQGETFRPHKHIRNYQFGWRKAQESWVVLSGAVRCILYDIDDSILDMPILGPGDASFTLHGGHTYEILEDNTYVYEYKTGPYEGQAKDKTFID